MNIAKPVSFEITDVAFSFYDPEEVKKISVKHVVNPQLLDNLNQPAPGGLYDPALGPFSKSAICTTCKLDHFQCPGHFGHIELPCPVIHPLLFDHVYTLMRSKCFYCHRFRLSAVDEARYHASLKLLQAGYVLEANEVNNIKQRYKSTGKTVNTMDVVEDEVNEESCLGDVETTAEWIERIEEYVREVLSRDASEHRGTTQKITTLASHERKQLIASFFRQAANVPRCTHCKGISAPLRKDGHSKIFQLPLPKKKQAQMNAAGKQTDDILLKASSLPNKPNNKPGFVQSAESLQDDAMEVDNEQLMDEDDTSTVQDIDIDLSQKPTTRLVDSDSALKQKTTLLTPLHLRNHLIQLFNRESRIVDLLYSRPSGPRASADIFFIEVLPVPPTRFRPMPTLGDQVMDNPQNVHLVAVLNTAMRIRELSAGRSRPFGDGDMMATSASEASNFAQLVSAWVTLQQHSEQSASPIFHQKEGLFRKHMMGKRVNYAARSVISPDPNIETSEIGIPPVFALKLTYPEPVTHYNIKEMRQAVTNGPFQWPGATHIQDENGHVTALDRLSADKRTALANQLLTPQANTSSGIASSPINKKVYRHIKNGDMLLVNRQPTLHKPSIMAHRARILPGEKTIRMHYANCNTYNADFDGDEMNLHFPQNEIARAEAAMIAATDYQYLVPTDGSPLRGLIQDHVVAGVWMTKRDSFFTREEYQQVLYGALRPEDDALGSGRILLLPPAIIKPVPLWTGKQVISTLLKNLTYGHPPFYLKSSAKVAARYWGRGSEEAQVVVHHGELVQGVLDKSQFGASAYGLVHTVYELYGPSFAGRLLSMLGRLFTKYLQSKAFTCRMDDLRLTPEGDAWRRQLMKEGKKEGPKATLGYIGLDQHGTDKQMASAATTANPEYQRRMEEVIRDDEKLQGLDAAMKTAMNQLTSSIISKCIPDGLFKVFPENNMQMMTVSGAKGSNVNVSQISCCLGQQELEGRRVPIMISGKSLPSFKPFDSNARAGGYIAGRFLTGIRPQEYFFHCMAGREGLIDTAVKTSRSGYLQRCLVKHLEGLKVQYDHTVRDTDGSVLQFQYGEDALDVTKQKHLQQFGFAASNYQALLHKINPGRALYALDTETAVKYAKRAAKHPEKYVPTLAVYSPSKYLGAVSEKFHHSLTKYIDANEDGLLHTKNTTTSKIARKYDQQITPSKFQALMRLKYLQSLVEPGESVGVLAAQSVGEPSTQMTLNTFHFAGFGAKNVTLGIPRLREIVMTASSNIKTPTMTMQLLDSTTDEAAARFANDISRLTMADVMDEVQVTERLSKDSSGRRLKLYAIRLKMFTSQEYSEEYNVDAAAISRAIETQFARKLDKRLMKQLRRPMSNQGVDDDEEEVAIGQPTLTTTTKKSRAGHEDDGEDDDQDVVAHDNDSDAGGDDQDATDAKMARLRKEMATYDGLHEYKKTQQDKSANEDVMATEDDDTVVSNEESEEARAQRIVGGSAFITRYSFDITDGAWCELELQFPSNTQKLLMVDIVQEVCRESVIREVPNIQRGFQVPNESENDTARRVSTEGLNFRGMWERSDIIDVNSIYSNDIAAILRTYGVEAARSAIIQEIAGVFNVYGIGVDLRHLSLIADYMTFEGGYKPFNRMGIDSNTSPFLKMSYEMTCKFLTQSTLFADRDELESPAARIVVGRVAQGGTGAFEIYQSLATKAK
ncbi:hypothetical protein BDF19DRAFT_434176 [Syncephalis fuscata]|nr:hypothetical protein BDF19DRAFT_434176 [Syncephalis fuscata]